MVFGFDKKVLNILKYFIQYLFYSYYKRRFLVVDYYKSRNPSNKKVLLSYITDPFVFDLKQLTHTNQQEAIIISKLFDDFNYQVDIVPFNVKLEIDYSKYDIIFGFGESYEYSIYSPKFTGKRIYYATGANESWQNISEIKRIISVNKSRNCFLLPQRVISYKWPLSIAFSDLAIIVGNNWTLSTYSDYIDLIPLYSINLTAFKVEIGQLRDISKSRNSFIWFGSNGSIHKGLDLCLEFFRDNPNLQLNICGPIDKLFLSEFKQFFDLKNIRYFGFVDVFSVQFKEVCLNSLFTILPTCSEGQSTSLLTTMGTGCIPISTKYSGLDVCNLGFEIESLDYSSLDLAIGRAMSHTDHQLNELSILNERIVSNSHNLNSFKVDLRSILINHV